MNRQILPAILCAIVALCSIFAAHGTVLVYEGFHPEDYGISTATGTKSADKGSTTGNYTTGVGSGGWRGMG